MDRALSRYVAVIGAGAAHFADTLGRYFADVIVLPPYSRLDPRVASHPDMLLARIGDTIVLPRAYTEEAMDAVNAIAAHVRVRLGDTPLVRTYPKDVSYNVLAHNGRVYCRADVVDATVAAEATAQGFTVRGVHQGYAGCSALSCGEVVLTADPSMRDALLPDGADVLFLQSGGIRLPGYDYGFIGGASGFAGNTAIFFGDPETHPDGGRIMESLSRREIECLPLSEDCLTDYGGIVCILKKMDQACYRDGIVL